MPTQNNPGSPYAQDRASRLAAAIIGIVGGDLTRWLHGEFVSLADTRCHVIAYLRDEISDIERNIISQFPRTD